MLPATRRPGSASVCWPLKPPTSTKRWVEKTYEHVRLRILDRRFVRQARPKSCNRTSKTTMTVTLADIQSARRVLRDVISATPILADERLTLDLGARVFLKAENTQRSGSFKIRGAYNM